MSSSYLLSSALSPAHFAFVNALESSTSDSEVIKTCVAEVARIKAKLGKGGGGHVRPARPRAAWQLA